MILWTFSRLPGFRSGAVNLSRESGHGESEIGADLRVSGRSIPENDQRQVQAADRLGPEGWPEALWRDQDWTAARIGRQLGNRAPGAQPRIEGADRDRADRPQGFWCRSAQGRISPDPQGQEFCSGDCRDPQLGDTLPYASECG